MKRIPALFLSAVLAVSSLTKLSAGAIGHDVTFRQFPATINGGEPIRGVDVSSVISVEEAGVKFHNDTDFREDDIFRVLAESGVNYIRVRVWNDPADRSGNSYGGGHSDVKTAAEIGRRAAKYGMKLLVDFHYSDFWADPGKQRVPKAWEGKSRAEKGSAIYFFTLDALKEIRDAGGEIGMVQVGNETNCHMCGEKDMYEICQMMIAGCNAVGDFDRNILKVLHFADPSCGHYPWYAKVLNECKVNYDVFATSYYPYWHGSTDNLRKVMQQIGDTYNKYVMVAETAYPYTNDDGDHFGNAVTKDSKNVTLRYPISVEGQADCLTDVFQAMADCGGRGLGVFYWEPAWIGVPDISWEEQSALWDQYGSGWATIFAGEYDKEAKESGGSSYDNQGLFNFWGYPNESLHVFGNIYPQTKKQFPTEPPATEPPTDPPQPHRELSDLIRLQKHLLRLPVDDPERLTLCDMDDDGVLDVYDLGLLKREILREHIQSA